MRCDDLKSVTIYLKFRIGDVVYLKIRREKHMGMVTGISVRPNGCNFAITWEGGDESQHYDIELTSEFIPNFDSDTVDD